MCHVPALFNRADFERPAAESVSQVGQPNCVAKSFMSVAKKSQCCSACRSLVCPGPCSVGRTRKAVFRPQSRAAAKSPLWAATMQNSAGCRQRISAVVEYTLGDGF